MEMLLILVAVLVACAITVGVWVVGISLFVMIIKSTCLFLDKHIVKKLFP